MTLTWRGATASRSPKTVSEGLGWRAVRNNAEEGLVVRVATSQRVEVDRCIVEVDFGANESMRPVFVNREAVPEHLDHAVVIRTPKKNDASSEWLL